MATAERLSKCVDAQDMNDNHSRLVLKISACCVFSLLIATLGSGIYTTLQYVNPELEFIQTYPDWSYNEKMHYRYKEFYDLMLFVQQHTSEDSTILIPRFNPWSDAGNIHLVRSFLYPRKIQLGTPDAFRQLTGSPNSYALIATGYNGQIWPSTPSAYGVETYIQPGWGLVDLSGG